MTTARDIAAELGIAASTVGRALADDPRISAPTKVRVKAVADRLGYVGNVPAQMMRGAPSKLIGLMIPDVANDFYAAIAQALSDLADARGYSIILFLSRDDPGIEARQVRELAKIRASGLIMVPTAAPLAQTLELARSLNVVQLLRHYPALGAQWFGMDDREALRVATLHLIERGHRRICYVGGSTMLSTGAQRLAGVRAAFADAAIDPAGLIEMLGRPIWSAGHAAMLDLLDRAHPPTAVVAGSSHITSGVIGALEERNIAVPDAISLIGFGNAPWYAWWRGGITAIEPAVAAMAQDCGRWCIERIEAQEKSAAGSVMEKLPANLVCRRSVAQR